MQKFLVKGGRSLSGEVSMSGSKNAALPILAATVLLEGQCVIDNVPKLKDVQTMIRMLNSLGLRAEHRQGRKVYVTSPTHKVKHLVPYELVTCMRASFFVAGPILGKTGFVKIPLPGGCAIGTRPVDIHLMGFKALGATVSQEHGFVEVKAKKLKGASIQFPFPSVGATENIMMAAVLAEGETIIENAAREPEIVDLANFLNQAGANIRGAGTETIHIQGVRQLKGIEYRIIPDRIETGTFAIAAAITHSEITLSDCYPPHIHALTSLLNQMGIPTVQLPDKIVIKKSKKMEGVEFETQPYPGFPTDMQSQMMSLCALAQGTSVIKENLFENRLMHVDELRRLGADMLVKEHVVIIKGVPKLSGCPVRTTDLRAAAALFLAGLAAEGETLVHDDGHLIRGYENLDLKLKALGAEIERL